MRRVLVPVLVLVLSSLAAGASAGPVVKPIPVSDVVRAAAARVEAAKIPRLAKHAAPKSRQIEAAPSKLPVASSQPSEPSKNREPVLTAEELAVDVVEFAPERLHSPQVGTWLVGEIGTWGVQGYSFRPMVRVPADKGRIVFAAAAAWIGGRSLLVECRGSFHGASKVTYGRWSFAKYIWEELGTLVVDIAGDDQLSFVVPTAPLAGWDRLLVEIEDADKTGADPMFQSCTFTRL